MQGDCWFSGLIWLSVCADKAAEPGTAGDQIEQSSNSGTLLVDDCGLVNDRCLTRYLATERA